MHFATVASKSSVVGLLHALLRFASVALVEAMNEFSIHCFFFNIF